MPIVKLLYMNVSENNHQMCRKNAIRRIVNNTRIISMGKFKGGMWVAWWSAPSLPKCRFESISDLA